MPLGERSSYRHGNRESIGTARGVYWQVYDREVYRVVSQTVGPVDRVPAWVVGPQGAAKGIVPSLVTDPLKKPLDCRFFFAVAFLDGSE